MRRTASESTIILIFFASFRYNFWLWLVFEKPRIHPTIQVQELKYIEKSLGESVQQTMPTVATTPWKEIFVSKPVYAIIIANFCRSWNFYMLVLYQSSYLKHVFDFKVAQVNWWCFCSNIWQ